MRRAAPFVENAQCSIAFTDSSNTLPSTSQEMGDSNTPFLLTYDQSASASSRGHPTSPSASSPVASIQAALSFKSDMMPSVKPADDSAYIGARKRLLEERVFGTCGAAISSSFPVDASGARLERLGLLFIYSYIYVCIYVYAIYSDSLFTRLSFADIIKLVAASSSSPSAPTFGSAFHTPAGGLHVSALPPAAANVTGSSMQEFPRNYFLFITRIILCSSVACIPRSSTSRQFRRSKPRVHFKAGIACTRLRFAESTCSHGIACASVIRHRGCGCRIC
jgi:hypothetical protein